MPCADSMRSTSQVGMFQPLTKPTVKQVMVAALRRPRAVGRPSIYFACACNVEVPSELEDNAFHCGHGGELGELYPRRGGKRCCSNTLTVWCTLRLLQPFWHASSACLLALGPPAKRLAMKRTTENAALKQSKTAIIRVNLFRALS